MSPNVALALLVAGVTLGVACLWLALRRRAERAARRAERLAGIAARIEAAVASIGNVHVGPVEHVTAAEPHATDVDDGLPGRAALLHAAAATIDEVRLAGRRLSAAVVRAAEAGPRELAAEARAVAEVPVYAVGPRSVALVLPDLGRADALGVLARIEARCPSSGKAVELEPGEDATELVARLLALGTGA